MTCVRSTGAFRRCPLATSAALGSENLNEAGSIWDLQREKRQQQPPTKHTDNQRLFLVLIKRERRKQSLWPGPPGSHQNTAALQGHGVGTASKVTATGVTESNFKRNWSQSSYALLKGLFMGAEVVLNSARSRSRGHDWGSGSSEG